MSSPADQPKSLAVRASWGALNLSLGCGVLFIALLMMDQALQFERTSNGVLMGFLPRTVLCVLWAGEALAVLVGAGSFLLIRRHDIESKAVIGIVLRSLGGIVAGLFGTLVLWLFVGHWVFGF
jgi:hypothetical protein